GVQRIVLELVPGSPLDLLARGEARDPFGPTSAPGNDSALRFSRTIETGNTAIGLGTILRYDASGGSFVAVAPRPMFNGRFAVKEAVNKPTAITIDAGPAGAQIESPMGGFSSKVPVTGAGTFVEWQYDLQSNLYRIVS